MSSRTRSSRLRNPGAAAVHRPSRQERQDAHRKLRRAAQIELRQMEEPDDLALPRPVHSAQKTAPTERPERQVARKRFRVWKTKGWKRRSSVRAERAASYHNLVRSL